MTNSQEKDNELFDWYTSLLKIMDYGDQYNLEGNEIKVLFKGLYSRTRVTIYNAFLFKYGIDLIINKRLPGDERGMIFETIITLDHIQLIKERLQAQEKDILL